jgi:hypothetical protein
VSEQPERIHRDDATPEERAAARELFRERLAAARRRRGPDYWERFRVRLGLSPHG